MEYLRRFDAAAFAAATGHINETLLDAESGGTTTRIQVVQGPKGTGSRRGLHTHRFDQVHYMISGSMMMDIGDFHGEAKPGTLVYLPAGITHRNTVTSDKAFFFNVLAPLSAWTEDGELPPGHPDTLTGTAGRKIEYLRTMDFAAFDKATGHINQTLLDAESGGTTTRIQVVQGPKGTGSRRGHHTHKFDQVHYMVSGSMLMEIGDFTGEATPGTLVYIPAGTVHRNTVTSDKAFFVNVLAPLSAWTPDGKEAA